MNDTIYNLFILLIHTKSGYQVVPALQVDSPTVQLQLPEKSYTILLYCVRARTIPARALCKLYSV